MTQCWVCSRGRLDPAGTRCPAWRVAGFEAPPLEYQMQPPQCIVNPATGKQHCIRLPEGLDINSDNPAVVRSKQRTFAVRDGA